MVCAEDLKAEGNAEFKAGNFLKAAGLYTKALRDSPASAVLFSNRSASLLKLKKVNKALADAEAAIQHDPNWDKGYFRKAAALEALDRNKEALQLYQRAAELNPSNGEVAGRVNRLGRQLQQASLSPASQVSSASSSAAEAWSVSDPQLQEFVQRVLALAKAKVEAEGLQSLQHSVCFYPPKAKDGGAEEQMVQMGVSTAFDSPPVLQECLSHLRQTAAESNFTAAIAIVNPAQVAFPQFWKHRDWPLGSGPPQGVLLQLDSLKEKRLAFLPVRAGSVGDPIPLKDTFKLLEPWFR